MKKYLFSIVFTLLFSTIALAQDTIPIMRGVKISTTIKRSSIDTSVVVPILKNGKWEQVTVGSIVNKTNEIIAPTYATKGEVTLKASQTDLANKETQLRSDLATKAQVEQIAGYQLSEENARLSGDNSLQSQINSEVLSRASGDAANANAIAAKASQTALDSEAAARVAGDAALQVQISNYIDTIIVVIDGQSNSIGQQAQTPPVILQTNLKVWNGISWVNPVFGQSPFNPNGADNAGIRFAEKLAKENPKSLIRFIQVGNSGQPISYWINNPYTGLYALSNTITAAIGTSKKIDVLLWIQGESDYNQTKMYYKNAFNSLYVNLLSNTWFDKTTKMVISGIYTGVGNIYGSQDETLKEIGSDTITHISYANTYGESVYDNVHWTNTSIKRIGEIHLYNAYLATPRAYLQTLNSLAKTNYINGVGKIGNEIALGDTIFGYSNFSRSRFLNVGNTHELTIHTGNFAKLTSWKQGKMYINSASENPLANVLNIVGSSIQNGLSYIRNPTYGGGIYFGKSANGDEHLQIGSSAQFFSSGNIDHGAIRANNQLNIGIASSVRLILDNSFFTISTFLKLSSVLTFADDAAAGVGGLSPNVVYKKPDGTLMIKL